MCLRGDLGHLLVDGDGVAIRRAELSAGQPDRDAVVVMAERSRMMQAADRRDDLAMLFQRLERPGELVVLARRGDLVVERMDAVREVDEGTAPRRGGLLLGRPQRDHALQERQRDASAQRTQGVAAVDQPGLGKIVAHRILGV